MRKHNNTLDRCCWLVLPVGYVQCWGGWWLVLLSFVPFPPAEQKGRVYDVMSPRGRTKKNMTAFSHFCCVNIVSYPSTTHSTANGFLSVLECLDRISPLVAGHRTRDSRSNLLRSSVLNGYPTTRMPRVNLKIERPVVFVHRVKQTIDSLDRLETTGLV